MMELKAFCSYHENQTGDFMPVEMNILEKTGNRHNAIPYEATATHSSTEITFIKKPERIHGVIIKRWPNKRD